MGMVPMCECLNGFVLKGNACTCPDYKVLSNNGSCVCPANEVNKKTFNQLPDQVFVPFTQRCVMPQSSCASGEVLQCAEGTGSDNPNRNPYCPADAPCIKCVNACCKIASMKCIHTLVSTNPSSKRPEEVPTTTSPRTTMTTLQPTRPFVSRATRRSDLFCPNGEKIGQQCGKDKFSKCSKQGNGDLACQCINGFVMTGKTCACPKTSILSGNVCCPKGQVRDEG